MTPNETLLSKFFDKLGKDTAESVLIWDLETKEELDNPYYQANHPLFENNNPYGEGYDLYYKSRFDTNVKIAGDGYKVTVKNKWLYLFKVKDKESSDTGFELYFVSKDNTGNSPEKICKAYPESDLYNQIADLYNAAAESSRHVKLSDSVIGTINGYMDIQFPEGIPF